MANLRYAPETRIEIDGEPVPAELRYSLMSVSCHSALEGADRVELRIANDQLRWLDHPLFNLDRDLTVYLGYAPDPLEKIFAGEITGRTANFPSSGPPTLTVVAQDRMQRLQSGTKVRWYAIPTPAGNLALPDLAVAGIASLENGLIPIFDPVGAALSVLLGGVDAAAAVADPDASQKVIRKQADESDFDFLSRLAAENGWEMFVEHRGPTGGSLLRFQSPLDHLTPDASLKYGGSLIDFSPRLTKVGQIASVTAYIWVAPIKTTFTITVGWDWDRMALTLDIRPALIPMGQGPSNFLIEEPVTPVSAPRKILSELIPRLNKRLTGTGSAVGDPIIRAGGVLRLEGLGVSFGGLYRVTSATHTLDSSGYRTSFNVRKEIWFGSIPLPEQGAAPVIVQAPFIG
jgi:uncharacterized protein